MAQKTRFSKKVFEIVKAFEVCKKREPNRKDEEILKSLKDSFEIDSIMFDAVKRTIAAKK